MQELFHSPIWIMIAKSLLALFMFGFGAISIYVVIYSKQWQEGLALIEYECNALRDMSMLQATVARSQLSEIRERMLQKPEKAEMEVISSIVKNSFPLLSMLMKKETNLIQWGLAGFKFVRSAYDYFSSKNKN